MGFVNHCSTRTQVHDCSCTKQNGLKGHFALLQTWETTGAPCPTSLHCYWRRQSRLSIIDVSFLLLPWVFHSWHSDASGEMCQCTKCFLWQAVFFFFLFCSLQLFSLVNLGGPSASREALQQQYAKLLFALPCLHPMVQAPQLLLTPKNVWTQAVQRNQSPFLCWIEILTGV